MKPNTTLIFAAALSLLSHIPYASAYGINCRGSFHCKSPMFSWDEDPYAIQLYDFISEISDDTLIEPGKYIACTHGVCAWVIESSCDSYDYDEGWIRASEAKEMAWQLAYTHKCEKCGSVAREWPVGKDDKDIWCNGGLKFGWVGADGREALCGPTSRGICNRFLDSLERSSDEVESDLEKSERKKGGGSSKDERVAEANVDAAKETKLEH